MDKKNEEAIKFFVSMVEYKINLDKAAQTSESEQKEYFERFRKLRELNLSLNNLIDAAKKIYEIGYQDGINDSKDTNIKYQSELEQLANINKKQEKQYKKLISTYKKIC